MLFPTMTGFGRERDSVSLCSTMGDYHGLIRPFESAAASPHLPARNVFCAPAPKHDCNNPRQVSSCLRVVFISGTFDLRLEVTLASIRRSPRSFQKWEASGISS